MSPNLERSSQTGLDTLAQAWLGAGATAVSIWDRQQLIRHWPTQAPLEATDFVTPVRISNNVFGEMRISGFSAPDRTGSDRPGASDPLGSANTQHAADHENIPAYRISPEAVRGLDIFADSRPSLEVGGDYYDFVHQPSGHLAFSVADIAGKGLSAAMLMPGMHRALRASLHSTVNSAPHELLAQLNDNVYSLFAHTGGFATVLLGNYDPSSRRVTYANAGHSPVIYRSAAGNSQLLKADCVPLGIQENIDSIGRSVSLDPGDVLVVATDGLAEAKNSAGQMFGYQRLLALINSLAHRTASSIARILFEQVAAFMGRSLQNDDHTVMVLKGVS